MEKTGSLIRESEKCKKCRCEKLCTSKNMELCAYVYNDKRICKDNISDAAQPLCANPFLREAIEIPTALGTMTVDKEDFKKQLYARLNINAGLMYGA